MILETKLLKNEKHQARVSLLLELVSDAYLTENRTRYIWSSTGNHFQLLVIEMLLGSRGLVVLSPAWKTTCSEFDSQ